MKKSVYILLAAVFLPLLPIHGQQLGQDLDGVNWKKTIRIRGLMNKFDPFNESNLYRLKAEGAQLSASPQYVQFENVASNFWIILRDTLEQALRRDELDVYTLGYGTNGLRTKRTEVVYDDLLDTLSLHFMKFAPANDRLKQMYDPTEGNVKPYFLMKRLMGAQSGGQRIINSFKFLSVYELELVLSVDETGFKIRPVCLIMGTAHWDNQGSYNPNKLLEGFYTGYDVDLQSGPLTPDKDKSMGFYIDLTDEKTIQFLIENGIQYSGEQSVIPFYDLITLFHYEYRIYAESNNIVDYAKLNFADKYADVDLNRILLNRYNDLTYSYLYGQAPQWWEQNKGSFTNGMFEVDTAKVIPNGGN